MEDLPIVLKIMLVIIIASMITALFFTTFFMADTITLKNIGTDSVPCIDNNGRPFENEMCIETIYCSLLGIAAEKRCAS